MSALASTPAMATATATATISSPPNITDIYIKSNTKKHRLGFNYDHGDLDLGLDFDDECPLYKIPRLVELAESFDPKCDVVGSILDEFLETQAAIFTPSPKSTSTSTSTIKTDTKLAKEIKDDSTLSALNHICTEPVVGDTNAESAILQIAESLKEKPKYARAEDKTQEYYYSVLIKNLRILYNSLVFKNYDFSKGAFNPDCATVLYEQLYKVNIYIRKNELHEFVIYIGFPYYLTICINLVGKVSVSRKNIYKLLDKVSEIEMIHYCSANTGYNVLDIISTSNFIGLMTRNYFKNGFDLLSKLIHLMNNYKLSNGHSNNNKIALSLEQFCRLYKQAINYISFIPRNE
jgi:hypothetical protein